jgi:hypothetical protein
MRSPGPQTICERNSYAKHAGSSLKSEQKLAKHARLLEAREGISYGASYHRPFGAFRYWDSAVGHRLAKPRAGLGRSPNVSWHRWPIG